METGRAEGVGVLWLVVVGIVLVPVVAVLLDAPAAVIVLASLCGLLAVIRAGGRREPAAFKARSRSFDLVFLAVALLALVVLAPAGYLT